MRRFLRWILWVLSPVLGFFLLAVIGAFVPYVHEPHGPKARDYQIILAAGPIHYDILLPLTDDVRDDFAFLADSGLPITQPSARWLSVGWGSEAFYTTTGAYSDLSLNTVWVAATGDSAVLRFEIYGPLPDHPKLRRIWVGEDQLTSLRLNILDAFEGARTALPIPGLTGSDVFYTAKGRFNLLRTCNIWVADQLSDAGLPMGFWTPTPYALTLSLWWNGHLGD